MSSLPSGDSWNFLDDRRCEHVAQLIAGRNALCLAAAGQFEAGSTNAGDGLALGCLGSDPTAVHLDIHLLVLQRHHDNHPLTRQTNNAARSTGEWPFNDQDTLSDLQNASQAEK